jgi:hypothetical protein
MCDIHVVSVEGGKKLGLKSFQGRDEFGDLGIDDRIIIKWILKKHCVKVLDPTASEHRPRQTFLVTVMDIPLLQMWRISSPVK